MMGKLADVIFVIATVADWSSTRGVLIEHWFSIIVNASIIDSHAKLSAATRIGTKEKKKGGDEWLFVAEQLFLSSFSVALLLQFIIHCFVVARLLVLNTFFNLTRQMDFLNGACHESISLAAKKLMCPMGSGHALHDAPRGCFSELYRMLLVERYFETLVSPLENKWIGSIHAPFTSDWIRSPLLKVAAL